jgi:uncharacterized protein YndB with AHSA1/START domain
MVSINHSLEVSCSPDAAFEALTTKEGIHSWWSKDADMGEGVGSKHELRFDKEGNQVKMGFVVDALSTGEHVRWSCTANANAAWLGTTLDWRLRPNGDGTVIEFAHDGFTDDKNQGFEMTADGWKHFASSLKSYLSGGDGQPW